MPHSSAPEPSLAPLVVDPSNPLKWDESTDVLIVGFGGAGACAALEARAHQATVTVLDRFHGGGATAISGGVFYGGGGTSIQKEAGVDDNVDEMFRYLSMEVDGIVSEKTLRRFCDDSVSTLRLAAISVCHSKRACVR
ncbi:MAG: FAD-dependent oxidoreductase [Polyangiales bacterium]